MPELLTRVRHYAHNPTGHVLRFQISSWIRCCLLERKLLGLGPYHSNREAKISFLKKNKGAQSDEKPKEKLPERI